MVSGEIADFGGKISVTKEGMAYAIETNNGNIKSASLAPAVPLIDAPDSIFANIDRKTAEDMVINYRILGNLLDVDSAVIEIRDDAGDIVFSEQVPVQAEGQVIWPAGQPMNPTPNDIRFQVENPDGTQSNFVSSWPEIQFGSTPTPILTLVNPWHVVRGATGNDAIVTLTGRNFQATSTVVFESDNGSTVIQLPASFTDNTKLAVLLPQELTSNVISGTVRVLNGGIESDTHILKIVEYALPDAPVLSSITPSQLNSSWNPADTWITIHGSNFIDNDTVVKSDHIPSELETEFISTNELRVLIPALWLSGPNRKYLRAESLTNVDLVSQALTLEILNTIGLNVPPIAPIISGINGNSTSGNSYVPLAPNPTSASTIVKITGEGFNPGAKVSTMVNGMWYDLQTTFINSRELSATVTAELFSQRYFASIMSLSLITGQIAVSQVDFTKGIKVTFNKLGEYGFHEKHFDVGDSEKHRVEAQIVVPMEPDSYNYVYAVRNVTLQDDVEWGRVKYVLETSVNGVEAEEYVKINNEPIFLVSRERYALELSGKGKPYNEGTGLPSHETIPIYLIAKLGEEELSRARLWLMPLRKFGIIVHFVGDTYSASNPKSVPNTWDTIAQFRTETERELNRIWKQANVEFGVGVAGGVEHIYYDTNKNEKLDSGEMITIIGKTLENRTTFVDVPYASLNEVGGIIHLYYVKDIAQQEQEQELEHKIGGAIRNLAGVYKLSDKDADNRLHIMYLSDKEAFT